MKYPKMYQPFKKAWIKALLSGKYKQGTGSLHTAIPGQEPTFCCLGVACEIAGLPKSYNNKGYVTYYSDIIVKEGFTPNFGFEHEAAAGILPDSFALDIDLDYAAMERLTYMNDTGKSFKQIAKWIERYL